MKTSVLNQSRQLLTACSFLLLITLHSEGQTTTNTLRFSNSSLSNALKRLKKERKLQLAVNHTMLRGYHIDSLTITGSTTEEQLTQLLHGFPFGFSIQRIDGAEQISIFPQAANAMIAIRGEITNEEKEPLYGANIAFDTSRIVQADHSGRFLLHTLNDSVQVSISMVGYHSLDTVATAQKANRFRLHRSYGELPVAQKTGLFLADPKLSPAQQPEAKDSTDNSPLTTVTDVISDETGAFIRPLSGLPSMAQSFELQGHQKPDLGTASGITTYPLVTVNGIPMTVDAMTQSLLFNVVPSIGNIAAGMDRQATLNNYDVGSVQVLKDAVSTAPFGSRGAHGVIVISTRKVDTTKAPGVTANIFQGISAATNLMDLPKTPSYLSMRLAAYQQAGLPPTDYDITGWDNDRYTNFPKAIFGGITGKTVVNLSGSWYNKKAGGYHSIGMNRERYPLPVTAGNDWYTTYSNIDYRIKRLTINLSLLGGWGNTILPLFDPRPSQYLSPNAPVANLDGPLELTDSFGRALNPFGFQYTKYKAYTWNLLPSLLCTWQPVKRLELSLRVGWSGQQTKEQAIVTKKALPAITDDSASAKYSSNYQHTLVIDQHADYTLFFRRFKLQLSMGTTLQRTKTTIRLAGNSYDNDTTLWNDQQRSISYDPAYPIHYRYAGGYFGFTVTYRKRLALQANGRIDASSRFSAENSTGVFGSVGAAYQLMRKDSINDKRKVFNWVKLRATLGNTGSDAINDYQYFSRWIPGTANNGYGGQPVLTPQNSYRPDVRWMEILKWNIGIDGKLARHIDITFNYYNNLTRNQFIDVAVPGQVGTSTRSNFDVPVRVRNTGLEFSLRSTFNITDSTSAFIQCTFTRPWNKLLSAPASFLDLIPGVSLSSRRVYTFLGKDSNNIFQVKDYNGDGKITPQDDAREHRDREVRHYWTCNMGLERGPFYFRIRFDGRSQPQFSALYMAYAESYPGSNLNGYLINKPATGWQLDGPHSPYQSPSVVPSIEQQRGVQLMKNSGAALESVYLIAIRQIDIRFMLPERLAQKIFTKSVQLYLQAKDLVTFSSYKVGNPFLVDPLGMPMIATAGIGANITF